MKKIGFVLIFVLIGILSLSLINTHSGVREPGFVKVCGLDDFVRDLKWGVAVPLTDPCVYIPPDHKSQSDIICYIRFSSRHPEGTWRDHQAKYGVYIRCFFNLAKKEVTSASIEYRHDGESRGISFYGYEGEELGEQEIELIGLAHRLLFYFIEDGKIHLPKKG